MRSNTYLINILHQFFAIGFWFGFALCLFTIALEVFTENGKVGALHTGHYSRGFPVPVRIDISIPDSIVTYEANGSVVGSSRYYKEDLGINNEAFLARKNRIPVHTKKEIIKNDMHIESRKDEKDRLNINSSKVYTDGYVNVTSASVFLNTVFFVKKYLLFFLWLACFYLLKKIFFQLKKTFSFTNDLVKRVKWLGLLFVAKELIQLVIVIFIAQYYDAILVDSYSGDTLLSQAIDITMSPRLDFNITIFVIGLSFLVLSSLFQMGNHIEQENQFTI